MGEVAGFGVEVSRPIYIPRLEQGFEALCYFYFLCLFCCFFDWEGGTILHVTTPDDRRTILLDRKHETKRVNSGSFLECLIFWS